MECRAPRVVNIQSLRKEFKNSISELVSAKQPTEAPNQEVTATEGQMDEGPHDEDPHESNLVLLRVQCLLLPLLLKKEILQNNFWATEVDSAAVGAALHSIVTELRQHRGDSLSAILETPQVSTSPTTRSTPTLLPTLKAYGVSLDDRRVHENLLRDLYVVNKKHGKRNTLYCKIRPNMTSSFVHVPSSKGFVRMKDNARKVKWIPDMLTALGGPGNDKESLFDILVYIGHNEEYKRTWEEAVQRRMVLFSRNWMTWQQEPSNQHAT
jgi:hypothetical protein